MRKLLAVSLIWCLCPALPPSLCLWNQLPETIDNYTLCLFSKDNQSVGQAGTLHLFFQLPFLLHLPLLPQTSENRGFLISVACSNPPVAIAMPLGVCQALRQKNLFKNITQDLSQGWVSVRNRVWGIVWESSCNTWHLQCFGISLLTKWSLEKKVKKSEKKYAVTVGIPLQVSTSSPVCFRAGIRAPVAWN